MQPSPAPTGHASALTGALDDLLARSAGEGVTIDELLVALSDRGVALLMVVCATPFLLPITIPGLSTPFGVLLALCGVAMIVARPVRLPKRLAGKRIAHASLERVARLLKRLLGRLERLLRPRAEALVRNTTVMRVHGVYILLMAVVLGIPFPPVFVGSNAIAAWPIFLLGLALLERDGVLAAIAWGWLIAFAAYWIAFGAALVELWTWMVG